MTQDEIIGMTRGLGICELTSKPKQSIHYSLTIHEMEALVKLVEDKTRQDLREEIVYTWVPPHFVDIAVETEREECAKICENFADQDSGPDGICIDYHAHLIRARSKK